MRFLDKLLKYYLILFFIIQNNFWLTNKLAVNEGLGLGRYRAVILIAFVIFGIILLMTKALTTKAFFSIKVNKIEVFVITIILFLIIFHIALDFFIYEHVDFIGVAPLVECIFYGVYFSLVVRKPILLNQTHILLFSLFVFTNTALELFYYFKDSLSGISYGPFRANIAGLVVNRNPSFFYPIFALIILRFTTLNFLFRTTYALIFLVFVLTLFYRTIYVALLFPFLVDLMMFGEKIKLKDITRFFVVTVILIFSLVVIDGIIENQFDFSILKAFNGRFTSTFTDYSEDDAQKDRVNQIPDMLSVIIFNPLGIGFSGLVKDAEVYNYAFYFLHPILYLGWFVIFYYWILFKKVYKIYINAKKCIMDRIIFICIMYFFLILTFFPYMNYFTFLSILIFLIHLSNKILFENTNKLFVNNHLKI